jgi:hypothetical protein
MSGLQMVYVLIIVAEDGTVTRPVVLGSLDLAQETAEVANRGPLSFAEAEDSDSWQALSTAGAVFHIFSQPVHEVGE